MNDLHKQLERLGIIVPQILLPRADIDPAKWAVIACDQHTSDRSYWQRVEDFRNGSPSTLDLVFPEVYLEDKDAHSRITAIQQAMKDYVQDGILKPKGHGWIYVQRRTQASGLRQGIVLAVDLERYDYSKTSTSLIRATEGTIVERLPPRIAVRKDAVLELPHIMILIDDREQQIIEPLEQLTESLEQVYDVDLMLDGGKLSGYWIDDQEIFSRIADGLERLCSPETAKTRYGSADPLLFAMGDGNHSLATAKAVWEEIKAEHLKAGGKFDDIADHPARYALAEIVNVYSPGLRFEPIHRMIFSLDMHKLKELVIAQDASYAQRFFSLEDEDAAKAFLAEHSNAAVFYSRGSWLGFSGADSELAPAIVDRAASEAQSDGAKIDFIHGWKNTRSLAEEQPGCAAFFNVIPLEELFGYVVRHGALPRKAFSMGDAEEKRYYFEARAVR